MLQTELVATGGRRRWRVRPRRYSDAMELSGELTEWLLATDPALRWQVRSTGAALEVAAAGYDAVEEVARRALGSPASP